MIDDKVNWASKVDEVWIFTESVNDISHSGQVNQRRQTPIHVADVKNVSWENTSQNIPVVNFNWNVCHFTPIVWIPSMYEYLIKHCTSSFNIYN